MLRHKGLGLAVVLTGWVGVAHAQNPNYIVNVGTGAPGDGTATITLDSSAGGNIQGWSWGVCHDGVAIGLVSVADGSTTATVAGGSPPAFDTINMFTEGWTVGVVISFLGTFTLPPGSGLEMNVAEYDISGLAPGDTSQVCMCDATLGSPPVANVVVVSGASVQFTGFDGCGTLVGAALPPAWGYDGEDLAVSGAGPTSTAVDFSVLDLLAPLDNTQGFSMGWSHTSVFTPAAVASVVPAGDVAGLGGGSGPDFFGVTTFPSGWTVGVVYAFLGGQFVQFPVGSPPAVTATYDYSITGDDLIAISVDNGLGSPPVTNVVVVGGASFDALPGSTGGSIALSLVVDVPFVRGDCNDDGIVNIADAVYAIGTLFYGYVSSCNAACDANDDGMNDLTDAVFVLNYQFLDGPPPPAPFPGCGVDPGADCVASSCP